MASRPSVRSLATVVACALLIAVSSALGGAAVARTMLSIPAPDGTITGCYKNSNGNARIVETAADCTSSETAVTWQQTGPEGPTGAPGSAGPPGLGLLNQLLTPLYICDSCDLHGADFQGASLVFANLPGANLTDADLSHADLRAMQLKNANLTGADFSGADLSYMPAGVSFSNQNTFVAEGSDFSHADFTGANLVSAVLSFGHFTDTVFTDAILAGANLFPAYPYEDNAPNLIGYDLSYSNLCSTTLSYALLVNANLEGAWARSDFQSANMTGANLRHADLAGAHFHEANLTGADLSDTIFFGNFQEPTGPARFPASCNSAGGAYFTSANLTDVVMGGARGTPYDVSGAIWSNTVCPDGTISDTNAGHSCVNHWLPFP